MNLVRKCGKGISSLLVKRNPPTSYGLASYSRFALEGFESCPLPKTLFPNPLTLLKNYVQSHLLITPYFDTEYSSSEFLRGAELAIRRVSYLISESKFDSLEGLVTSDVVNGLKTDLPRLSLPQRSLLPVSETGYSFIHRIGIIMPGEEGSQRFVETAVVSFYHPSLKLIPPDASFQLFRDFIESEGGLIVLNYRFIRDFSKGISSRNSYWVINAINHFHLNTILPSE